MKYQDLAVESVIFSELEDPDYSQNASRYSDPRSTGFMPPYTDPEQWLYEFRTPKNWVSLSIG